MDRPVFNSVGTPNFHPLTNFNSVQFSLSPLLRGFCPWSLYLPPLAADNLFFYAAFPIQSTRIPKLTFQLSHTRKYTQQLLLLRGKEKWTL